MYTDIKLFHKKFGLAYNGEPRALPEDLAGFRVKFMHEELAEYEKAMAEGDMEGMLDALVDLVYVALGTAYLHGFPFNEAWDEVQRANMRKVKAGPNGEGSKRGSPHDVIKPPGWKGPDIARVLAVGKRIGVWHTKYSQMLPKELRAELLLLRQMSRSDREEILQEMVNRFL